jgi:oxaloacetate decarboxylase (Na+ extruding) subunit gamma
MPDLMSQGLNLALYGMGTVFFFLAVLVVATVVMSALVPSPEVQTFERRGQVDNDLKIHAAIGAAIRHHRRKHDKR